MGTDEIDCIRGMHALASMAYARVRRLLDKSSDADLLREMIGFSAEWLMELALAGLTGAVPDERCESRIKQRSGYGDPDWQTRAGTVELRSPSDHRSRYVPASLEVQHTAENALTAVTSIQGISTRPVDDLVRAMGMDGANRAQAGPTRMGGGRTGVTLARPLSVQAGPPPPLAPVLPIRDGALAGRVADWCGPIGGRSTG